MTTRRLSARSSFHFSAAGGICCSITHGALTPVDVVKTRVQLDPVKVCEVIGSQIILFGDGDAVVSCDLSVSSHESN